MADFEDTEDFNENQDFSMQTGAPTMEVANDAKKEIKKSLMGAMGSVANEIASPESLLQVEGRIFNLSYQSNILRRPEFTNLSF